MSEHLWYYELHDSIHGPISTDEIQTMVAGGRLSANDRIRPESSEEWISVVELKTLVENVASGEDEWEEVTDLDDLNFTFEESSAGIARTDETADEKSDDRHLELDIDSFQLSGDPEDARHSAFQSAPDSSSETMWMVESVGQVLGPLTMHEVIGMAEIGALVEGDKVRKQDDSEWDTAESIPELAAVLAGTVGTSEPVSTSESDGTSEPNGFTVDEAALAGKETSDSSGHGPKNSAKSRTAQRSSKAGSKKQPGRKRRRKKKRSKKDQLLAEIFSDVFAEDGKVRDLSERPDLAKPAAHTEAHQPVTTPASANAAINLSTPINPTAPVNPSAPAPTEHLGSPSPSTAIAGAASPAGYPSQAMPPTGSPMAGGPPTGGPPTAGAMPAPAAFVPPAKQKKQKSGGGSISLPEPPVLAGIGGAILVVILGVGGFMGWIPLPGFGPNAKALFAEFNTEFPKISKTTPSKEEWATFRNQFLNRARVVGKAYTSTAGTDPKSRAILNKSLLIVRILEFDAEAQEAQQTAWEKYLEVE